MQIYTYVCMHTSVGCVKTHAELKSPIDTHTLFAAISLSNTNTLTDSGMEEIDGAQFCFLSTVCTSPKAHPKKIFASETFGRLRE